jgi:hypothetical protein
MHVPQRVTVKIVSKDELIVVFHEGTRTLWTMRIHYQKQWRCIAMMLNMGHEILL